VVLNPIPGQRVLLDEPELTNLLKKARRPGTANIVEILLALYDGDDWSPNTRNRPIRVREPFFCLLTASTPESLEMTLEDIDIDSGLIPRFASFWCTPREPIAYPPPPDEGLLNRIVEEFQDITRYGTEIGASQGALNLSHEARKEWESAYRDFTMESRKAPKAVAAIMTRVPTQVMKWSLLYAIQASHANIEMDDLARGILVGTYLMETARLIPGYVSKAQVARVEQKIIESLTRVRGKWLTASSIHHLVSGRVKASELRGSLRALVELEVIEEGTSESGKANIYRVS